MSNRVTLKNVTIDKYKSIETPQSFDVESAITVLVGKNESGKTAILEAINKSNAYQGDQFNQTHDYPRKWLTRFARSDDDVTVIRSVYTLSEKLIQQIQEDIGAKTFGSTKFVQATRYRTTEQQFEGIEVSVKSFLNFKLGQHAFGDEDFKTSVRNIASRKDIDNLRQRYPEETQREFLERIQNYFERGDDLETALNYYVVTKWISPHLPQFLYYDEYYELPSDIDIRQVHRAEPNNRKLMTARALFELAFINIDELIRSDDYETYKAQLEATGNEITDKLFEYWSTNRNLQIQFDIERSRNNDIIDPVLKIRVHNSKYRMTLPLDSRSRGFNWFFSFLVWFSRIQGDREKQYILLLDEPGLNLHASAQKDLLHFIEDLANDETFSNNYQIIYTTHSGFMIDTSKINRVRTVYEGDKGTQISDVANERDPDTLIPLQAALGYDIVQHLFVSENNLLVEGVSDLTYLTVMSSILQGKDRKGLSDDVAIVPVGGADKVATFVALIRGQELNIACLLDTFTEYSKKQRVDDLIDYKIIHQKHVRYFHEFAENGRNEADIEDMFEPVEFLALYNETLHHKLNVEDLDQSIDRIVEQIRKKCKKFNAHYQVSKTLATRAGDADFISDATLDRFAKMFEEINKLFKN